VADAALARAARRVVGLICGGARSSSTTKRAGAQRQRLQNDQGTRSLGKEGGV
jgi:hypothetical protein